MVWVKGQNVVWVSDEHVAESPKLGGVIAGVLIATKCDEIRRLASGVIELSDEGTMLSTAAVRASAGSE